MPEVIVNVYVDGYNFYRPIQQKAEETRDAALLKMAWCDYPKLAARLAQACFGAHQLGAVKLFTAYARDEAKRILNAAGVERKNMWLEAQMLNSRGRLHICFGRWELQGDAARPKEKMTDVKLAVSLVRDAFWKSITPARVTPFDPEHPYADDDPPSGFHKAILVSSDKDFLAAAELVARDAKKEVAIAFPLFCAKYDLPPGSRAKQVAITREDLHASHLPDEIARADKSMIRWHDYVMSKGWPLKKTAGS